jgi:hypothetical protein
MLNTEGFTGGFEAIGGEATAAVGQHMGDAEWKGGNGVVEKRRGAGLGLLVRDGEVNGARGAVDGDIKVTFTPLAIGGLKFGQVFDVDMDEAEIIVLELFGSFLGRGDRRRW